MQKCKGCKNAHGAIDEMQKCKGCKNVGQTQKGTLDERPFEFSIVNVLIDVLLKIAPRFKGIIDQLIQRIA